MKTNLSLKRFDRPLSNAAIRALRVAAQRKPAYILPLPEGVQGIAARGLLRVLRERGYIQGYGDEGALITDKGREVVARRPSIPNESI